MLEIDGSKKSGSGTIVRDVMALASLTRQPVRLTNIRAARRKPGLRPQHLTSIQAAAELSQGRVNGASINSNTIEFYPGDYLTGGDFNWDIKTAGSTTMMAMTLIPIALFAEQESILSIKGGLFQDYAPTAFYLQKVFLKTLEKLGAEVRMTIVRPGYVPEGGGEIMLHIKPVKTPLKQIALSDQGEINTIHGIAFSSHLESAEVSERMADSCEQVLQKSEYNTDINIRYDSKRDPYYDAPALGAGAAFAIWAETSSGCVLGADMAGARGRPSEYIGESTAHNFLEDILCGATVDRFLADQLIPYSALAEGNSIYQFPELTDHIESRLWLIQKFLNADSKIHESTLTIHGVGFQPNS
ncbi:MAG: RNA 3'-phosphate cyclase [Candidatus Marinimicrobia bacterium]|nr:RNA 3'-phosphate cyclase [Candidatus Neomarinimicrobiota bacterium]